MLARLTSLYKRTWGKSTPHDSGAQSQGLRFEDLADMAPVGVFHTDTAGSVMYVNQCWRRMAGMVSESALGAGWMQSLHPVDRAWPAAEWKSYLARPEPGRWEYRFKQPDGRVAWVIAEIAPHFGDHGRLRGHVGAVTDITER